MQATLLRLGWDAGDAEEKQANHVPIISRRYRLASLDLLLDIAGKAYAVASQSKVQAHLCNQLHGFRLGRGTGRALFRVSRKSQERMGGHCVQRSFVSTKLLGPWTTRHCGCCW